MQKEQITIQPDFLIIPGPVAFCPNLQPADLKVYGVIYWLDSLKEGKCTASNQYIGKVCLLTPKSVGNSLQNLENEGFIKRLFKDSKKKVRSQILPLATYRFHQTMEHVPSNNGTRVPSNDGQIRKRLIRKSNTVVDSPEGSSTDGKKDSKEQKDRPMNLQQFVEWCGKSKQKHVQLIGEWADTTKPEFETVEQWEAYINRHLRAAKNLTPFTREQLEKGYAKIVQAKKQGWLEIATLETLYKFITSEKINA